MGGRVMTETLTGRVPVAAAILQASNPHPAPVRCCSVCGMRLPAGYVKHVDCRGES
jgi:hypothetical protein